MTEKILVSAKAWTALIGAAITAVLGTVPPDDPIWKWLTVAAAICTAIATYAVPNATAPGGGARVADTD